MWGSPCAMACTNLSSAPASTGRMRCSAIAMTQPAQQRAHRHRNEASAPWVLRFSSGHSHAHRNSRLRLPSDVNNGIYAYNHSIIYRNQDIQAYDQEIAMPACTTHTGPDPPSEAGWDVVKESFRSLCTWCEALPGESVWAHR